MPHIAKHFPKAKLVFISSGPYFKPGPRLFRFILDRAHNRVMLWLARLVVKSDLLIKFFYELIMPFDGTTEDKKLYQEELDKNIDFIRGIEVRKNIEFVEFAKATDNTNLLAKLKNPTLIFSGRKDELMPESGGELMHKIMPNSKLVIRDGDHFNVFISSDLSTLGEFVLAG